MDKIDFSILNKLSDSEKELALSILKEYSNKGESEKLNSLLLEDYNEIPVEIEQFITDENYLGKAWKDKTGKLKLYPFWLETLKKIFPTNIDTDYDTLLESGARGIGKSEIACGCVCTYLMYRIMCMKDPREFYHLKLTENIVFAFMNIKKDLAEEIAVSKFQHTIQMSPWFMSKGSMTQRNNEPYWVPPDPISIVIGSQSDDVVGKPIYFAFFDEISFIRNQDIDKQKKKAKDMIDTAVGGMTTRFIHDGKNPTMLVVASSKRSEQSFMEAYIKLLSENEGNNVLVVDKPVWEVKPVGTYGEGIFYVALGNKFLSSLVIPDEDNDKLDQYKERGYKILEVPRYFKAKFLEDLERNLCDIAGVSVTSSNKYMSAELVNAAINKEFKNPFPDIIETGNNPQDKLQYYQLFNMDNIPKSLITQPLFIHLDMSISGDMTGIAGVWITGKKVSTDANQQARDLTFRLAFSTSIKAPKGYQVSFEKNRNFIRWLRDSGFNVKKISYDTFQSYDTGQQLKSEGFECTVLSVDRVDSDKICKPYQYLKNTIYEKRFVMYKSDRLFDEFVDVERNINSGKIDHTTNYHKDALDAVCGATFTASSFAEQYAYDYGESLDNIALANDMTVSSSNSIDSKSRIADQKQMLVDFEEELKKMRPVLTGIASKNDKKDNPDVISLDGMIIW